MEKMEMDRNFSFSQVRRRVTVLNIIEKFLGINIMQVYFKSVNQSLEFFSKSISQMFNL